MGSLLRATGIRASACLCRMVSSVLLASLLGASASAQTDWPKFEARAVELLQQYLRINTSNPPGNERPAAEFFCALFAQEGIECRVFEIAPGRANMYARLRGDGSRRPIILLTHLDVVTADAKAWSVPPFSGEIRSGAIYGRGAQDTKAEGVARAMALIALKRAGLPLARDIIFLGVADEEVSSLGSEWMIEHQRELIARTEYLIDEGSANLLEDGAVRLWGVDVAVKVPFWLRLTARGTPGHSAEPSRDAATHRLARALGRLADYETPLKVVPVAQREICEEARVRFPEEAEKLCHLDASLRDSAIRRRVTTNPDWNSLLRNTISITVLRGGPQTNVLPAEASAELDVRLLPGEDPQKFLEGLRGVIADPGMEIAPIRPPRAASASPADTELWRVMERAVAEYYPAARVVPRLLTSSTESPMYRRLGIVAYGFFPFACSEAEADTAHGTDERISMDAFKKGVRLFYDIVAGIASKQ